MTEVLVPRKLKPKQWRTKADVLFSKIIRERDKRCVRCGSDRNLQCAHIVSRTYSATRTDERNGITLCAGCHLWWHAKPVEAGRWFDQTYPGLYDNLKSKAETVTKVDWEAEYDRLKFQLTLLDDLRASLY